MSERKKLKLLWNVLRLNDAIVVSQKTQTVTFLALPPFFTSFVLLMHIA